VLIDLIISAFSLGILCIGCVCIYQELTHTFPLFSQLYIIKNKLNSYPLRANNLKRWTSKVNLLVKYFMNQLILLSLFVTTLLVACGTVLVLMDPQSDIPIISLILGTFIMQIMLMQTFSILWCGFSMWFIVSLYIKYKFTEINTSIQMSINLMDNTLLMRAIREHNVYIKLTREFNTFFSWITFIIYYITTPGFLICLYAMHHKDTKLYTRIFFAFLVFVCFVSTVFMNIMSTWITKAAHKPQALVYKYQAKTPKIPTKCKLKIHSFIERLSGPSIGFYCYDLFPMDNWEFYQFLYISGSNYVLLMNLL